MRTLCATGCRDAPHTCPGGAARIDAALQREGTNKSKLLTAQVWLADMQLCEAHNAVWNAWVDPQNPPARACVRADLARPAFLVEIMVTAAK